MKKTLISLGVLIPLHSYAAAFSAPLLDVNQLELSQYDAGVCSSADYRPINMVEAKSVLPFLLDNMNAWQSTSLADGWVLTGTSLGGEFQKGHLGRTWCYPVNPDTNNIERLAPWLIPAGDELEIQRSIVHNSSNLIIPLSTLANNIGYSWTSGDLSPFPGEDMNVVQEGNKWILSGSADNSCVGYSCNNKTQIIIDNFSYVLDPATFEHGDVQTGNKELVKVISSRIENYTDEPQSATISIEYEKNQSWSKTEDHSFATNVEVKTKFIVPVVGDMDVAIAISNSNSWGSQYGEGSVEKVSSEASITVPPHSYVPVKVELYRASISYPYQFMADIAYDVTYKGILKHDNAWVTHPTNRPYKVHTFNINKAFNAEKLASKSGSISYQWSKQYFPGETNWWDWNWVQQNNGLDFVKRNLAQVLRPIRAPITGTFYAESQFASEIQIGNKAEVLPVPLTETPVTKGKVQSRMEQSNQEQSNQEQEQILSLDNDKLNLVVLD